MSLNRLLLALPVACFFVPAMAHASGDVGGALRFSGVPRLTPPSLLVAELDEGTERLAAKK